MYSCNNELQTNIEYMFNQSTTFIFKACSRKRNDNSCIYLFLIAADVVSYMNHKRHPISSCFLCFNQKISSFILSIALFTFRRVQFIFSVSSSPYSSLCTLKRKHCMTSETTRWIQMWNTKTRKTQIYSIFTDLSREKQVLIKAESTYHLFYPSQFSVQFQYIFFYVSGAGILLQFSKHYLMHRYAFVSRVSWNSFKA